MHVQRFALIHNIASHIASGQLLCMQAEEADRHTCNDLFTYKFDATTMSVPMDKIH